MQPGSAHSLEQHQRRPELYYSSISTNTGDERPRRVEAPGSEQRRNRSRQMILPSL